MSHDPHSALPPRPVPPHRDDLAARIIAQAATTPQRMTFWQWLRGVCQELHIPQPALSAAFMVMVGVALGININVDQETDITETSGIYSYYDEGGIDE